MKWNPVSVTGLVAVSAMLSMMAVPAAAQRPDRSSGIVILDGARSYLGVAAADITSDRARELNLREERGVEITRVEDDSPAARAGVQVGDVVIEYNGQRVEGGEQFVRLVRETPVGRQAKLVVSRGGSVVTLTATIGSRQMRKLDIGEMHIAVPAIEEFQINVPEIPRPMVSWRSPVLGVEAESLPAQLAEYFGVQRGVLVRSVSGGSAAEKAGMKAGDVIVEVDGTSVSTPADVTRQLRAADKGSATFKLVRQKKEMTLSVTVDRPGSAPARGRSVRLNPMQY